MNVSVKLSTIVTCAVFYGVIESYRAWNGSKYVSDFVTHSPTQSQPGVQPPINCNDLHKIWYLYSTEICTKNPNVGDLIKYFIPLATCSIKSSSQVKEVSAFRIQQQTKKLSVHIWKYSIAKLDTMEWNNVDIWSSDPGLAKIKKPKWIPDRCQAPILWKYGNARWWQSYSIEDWCWDIYTVSMNPATVTASYEWLLPPHNASISCPANFRSHQIATNHNIQYSVCRPSLADVGTQYISKWYRHHFTPSSRFNLYIGR